MCTSLALPTTINPHSPMVHIVAFMLAVEKFSAEQGFWPQHNCFLARRHSLGTTLASSFDPPAHLESGHQLGNERVADTPTETTSAAFMRAVQTVCSRERAPVVSSSQDASDHEPRMDSSPAAPPALSEEPDMLLFQGQNLRSESACSLRTESACSVNDFEETLDWCKATARDGGHRVFRKSPHVSRTSSLMG